MAHKNQSWKLKKELFRTGTPSESRNKPTAEIQNWKNYSKKIHQKYSRVPSPLSKIPPTFYSQSTCWHATCLLCLVSQEDSPVTDYPESQI